MTLTDAQEKEVLAAVREMRTKVRNIEQFVEPPDDWKVRVQWLAKGLSAMRTHDIGNYNKDKSLTTLMEEIGEKLDSLKTYVEGLQ